MWKKWRGIDLTLKNQIFVQISCSVSLLDTRSEYGSMQKDSWNQTGAFEAHSVVVVVYRPAALIAFVGFIVF